jgi:hypothetical protein
LVLLSYILRVIRALFLPVLITFVFLQWLCPSPATSLLYIFNQLDSEGVNTSTKVYHASSNHCKLRKKKLLHQHKSLRLMNLPDFHQTGTLPLTDIFLMNSHFVTILSLYGFHYSNLIMALGGKTYLYLTLVMKVAYLWFVPSQRKPPDIHHQFPTSEGGSNGNTGRASCFDTKLRIFTPKEVSSTDVVTCQASHDHIHEHTENSNDIVHHVWKSDRSHASISRPRIIKTQVLIGSQDGQIPSFNSSRFDIKSLVFVVDTGSSDHLCKDKELFIGEIVPLQHVKLQGVGGLTEAKGYGTIKFNIFDDDGVEHNFTIHNVLYVPDAPMNLLSPQKWIAGLTAAERRSRGTMSITFDDVTLLIWSGKRFMKTIHHRPDIGIPLLAVNEDLKPQREDFIIPTQFCQPCCPAYLQTSKASTPPVMIEDDESDVPRSTPLDDRNNSEVHIIPDDENDLTNDDTDHTPVDDSAITAPIEDVDDPNVGKDVAVSEVILNDDQANDLISALKRPLSDLEQEFLLIHHKLKHLPEKYLHRMARQGLIPKKFLKVSLPPCAACIFGKQSKRPW